MIGMVDEVFAVWRLEVLMVNLRILRLSLVLGKLVLVPEVDLEFSCNN
jgi:hypothetical protein